MAGELIACHECDQVHRHEPVPEGARALCMLCGAELYRSIPDALNRSLALYLAAFGLLLVANLYPFIALQAGGRIEESMLFAGGYALYQHGMGGLGFVVLLTSVIFPAVVIGGMLYLLIPVRLGHIPPGIGPVYRMVHALTHWSLIGVFLLGVFISIVKLQSMARVIPGVSLFAFVALLVVYSAARAAFDPRALWDRLPAPAPDADAIARGEPMTSCHTCHLLVLQSDRHEECPRCGSALHERKQDSIDRTWSLVVTAAILFIPANLLPIMTVSQMGKGDPDTIVSGVMKLMSLGMYGLAIIVFFVSIIVPVMKLAALSFLLRSVQTGSRWRPRDRTFLYRVTEVVGSWSMVDVYIVGLLTALVSMGAMAGIEPGPGILYFAGVVVVTMFAANSFDPRLMWDVVRSPEEAEV